MQEYHFGQHFLVSASGLKPDPASPALLGLTEPANPALGAFHSPAVVSSGADFMTGTPTQSVSRLGHSGAIRRAFPRSTPCASMEGHG